MRLVKWQLFAGRVFGGLPGVLAVVPYITLVHLGDVLLRAAAAGVVPQTDEVRKILFLLIGVFLTRLFLYFVALACTHVPTSS